MKRREFLMLAHEYVPGKTSINNWYMSEKLDGMRAFWDGGVTRGMPTAQVPFANTDKDGRLLSTPISTGLWSRYGKVIHAPDWWLDQLPKYPLDGELYIGRQKFQELMSIVKDINPSPEWKKVVYKIFDVPSANVVFGDGKINVVNFQKVLSGVDVWFANLRLKQNQSAAPMFTMYESAYNFLTHYRKEIEKENVHVHEQVRLPGAYDAAVEAVEKELIRICDLHGEGLILRRPASIWQPQRIYDLLKVKKLHDAEATVIGYKWGKETDKGSKLLGLMGSLTCVFSNGIVFDLSGFTDDERKMDYIVGREDPTQTIEEIGAVNQGQTVDETIENRKFPRGTKVTFKYRELTQLGAPKEARYWRKHHG